MYVAGWLDVTMCVHLDVVCDGRLRHPRYPLRRRHDDDDGHHRKTNVVFFLSKDAATSINWVVCYVWGPHWRHPIEKGGQLVVCLQNSNLYSYWERKMSMGMILIVGMHVWHSDKQICNFLNHLKHCWLGSISRDKRESNGLCAHIPMSGSLDLVIDKWWGPNLDFLFIAHVLLIMLQETSAELAIPESLLNLMFILFCTCPLNSAGRSVSSGEIPFSA